MHKHIKKVLRQNRLTLLNSLKTESQLHIQWRNRPIDRKFTLLLINLGKSHTGIVHTNFRVIHHAIIVLRDGIIIIRTIQIIRRVQPELQDPSFRINIIVWQFRAVNLRNHAQRIAMSIGGHIHAFWKVGHSPKLRRGH